MVLLSCIMLYKNICNYLIAILFMDKSVTIALAKQSTLVYMQRCARQKLCNGSQQEQTTALTFGVVSVELIFRMDENQVLALMVQSLKNAVLVSSKWKFSKMVAWILTLGSVKKTVVKTPRKNSQHPNTFHGWGTAIAMVQNNSLPTTCIHFLATQCPLTDSEK